MLATLLILIISRSVFRSTDSKTQKYLALSFKVRAKLFRAVKIVDDFDRAPMDGFTAALKSLARTLKRSLYEETNQRSIIKPLEKQNTGYKKYTS